MSSARNMDISIPLAFTRFYTQGVPCLSDHSEAWCFMPSAKMDGVLLLLCFSGVLCLFCAHEWAFISNTAA